MFCNCPLLNDLNINNFNTSNITKMDCMLFGCTNELKNKIIRKCKIINEDAFYFINMYENDEDDY